MQKVRSDEERVPWMPDNLHFVVTLFGKWWDLLQALLPGHDLPLVLSNPPLHRQDVNTSWQARVSVFILNLLHYLSTPLRTFNCALEWLLNFLQFNHGIVSVVFHLALGKCGSLIWNIPKDSPAYFTALGYLDTRLGLLEYPTEVKAPNAKGFIDICIMASKLVYESPYVQKRVVQNEWKMCFQTFLDCWNDRMQENTTEAFVFTDKPETPNAVFVAFRGTEPFNTDDWSTDFDFSWLELDPGIGKVHVGFLEALGLVNRNRSNTFDRFRNNCLGHEALETQESHKLYRQTSGLTSHQAADQEEDKILAFDAINKELIRLLHLNPDAHIFLTGHSLGGALALVFLGVLMFKLTRTIDENKVLQQIVAVHTFGQPRVGDQVFAEFLNSNMRTHNVFYYRIVYGNDIISRIPFDNEVFKFKHAGTVCHYYNSLFSAKSVEEVPNKNFFSPFSVFGVWITAVWELLRSVFLMTLMYGTGFRETILMTIMRLFGLVFPGVVAHMPVNYVNAVRLGPSFLDEWPENHDLANGV